MRISDWSSDVCSSDLKLAGFGGNPLIHLGGVLLYSVLFFGLSHAFAFRGSLSRYDPKHLLSMLTRHAPEPALGFIALVTRLALQDRKSVVKGKSGSVRVALVGSRTIKKKKSEIVKVTEKE